jgi:hypothetical protein
LFWGWLLQGLPPFLFQETVMSELEKQEQEIAVLPPDVHGDDAPEYLQLPDMSQRRRGKGLMGFLTAEYVEMLGGKQVYDMAAGQQLPCPDCSQEAKVVRVEAWPAVDAYVYCSRGNKIFVYEGSRHSKTATVQ